MKKNDLCGLAWLKSHARETVFNNTPGSPVYIADLFTGCGGLTLGAKEALYSRGYVGEIVAAIENDPEASAVYRANFFPPDRAFRQVGIEEIIDGGIGDPHTHNEAQLVEQIGKLDLLLAGPPCQGHSDLNNHTRRSDHRNSLYLRAVRFAELTRPKAIVIENVPPVVHDKTEVVSAGEQHLRRLGYETHTLVLAATQLGIPQTRRRHLLVGVKDRPGALANLQLPEAYPLPTLRDYIADLEDEPASKQGLFYTPSDMSTRNRERVAYLFEHGLYDLPNLQRPKCHRGAHSYVSMYGRLSWDKPAQTITSGFGSMGQGRYVHPSRPRVITPHEAARLQGIPDFFDWSGVEKRTSLHRLIGNAVPPRLGGWVVQQLIELQAFGEQTTDAGKEVSNTG